MFWLKFVDELWLKEGWSFMSRAGATVRDLASRRWKGLSLPSRTILVFVLPPDFISNGAWKIAAVRSLYQAHASGVFSSAPLVGSSVCSCRNETPTISPWVPSPWCRNSGKSYLSFSFLERVFSGCLSDYSSIYFVLV